MDMVNDGKDTRLDTPQAVKEALASGKDLYNPETGEFWWKYNDTGSIANTYIYLDDPNLLAVIDNPDFDLFEDIVGWLNYTGRIADSPDYYAENADDYPDAPDYGCGVRSNRLRGRLGRRYPRERESRRAIAHG